MALKYNTFRSQRYLRSRFVEGRYLLASENTDLELELIDFSRRIVKFAFGNIAVDNSWKVERYSITTEITGKAVNVLTVDSTLLSLVTISDAVYKSGTYITFISAVDPGLGTITVNNASALNIGDTIEIKLRRTVLIRSGEAWYEGFPFVMQGGKDHRVSGSNLALGLTRPAGGGSAFIEAQDEPQGLGKLVSFSSGGTTPGGTYRFVIGAREEVITSNEDQFLQNVNVPEATVQKMRTNYRVNVVAESEQNSSPIPYTSSSTGNLVNEIIITPVAGQNGSEFSRTAVAGSEKIDGRDLEITIRNDPGLGTVIPSGTTEQQEFFNGKFIDSVGNVYHLNAIFNDVVSTRVILRIDKDVSQVEPQIIPGRPYKIVKKDVFVTDDVQGNPQGTLYWPIAALVWDQVHGITHDSKLYDLRNRIIANEEYQELTNVKFGLRLAEGGKISFDITGDSLLTWSLPFSLINPYGPEQLIQAGTQALLNGGSLVYTMNLKTGGVINKGTKAVTIASISGGGITLNFAGGTDLSTVRVGNVIKVDGLDELAYIVSINDTINQCTVHSSTTITSTGAATIYLDSFGPGTAPLNEDRFVLSVRKGNKVYVGGALELEPGEENELGDGVPTNLLTFIGATHENDPSPNYPSVAIVTQGTSLVNAIGELDAAVNTINNILNFKAYDERILYPAGLAALTTITIPTNSRNAGIQEQFDAATGELEIYTNGLFRFQNEIWEAVSSTQIRFLIDLPPDTEVHFRKDTLGGSGSGGGGGGSGTLQDAYNLGSGIISTISGKPFQVTGAAAIKAYFDGDIQVTGVIL